MSSGQPRDELSAQGVQVAGRLADVSLTLAPAQVTAICGPNGAGKSTLLAALTGLLVPQDGRVWLNGGELAQMADRDRARAIGYLPQAGEVAWDLSVRALVGLGVMPWAAAPLRPGIGVAEQAARVDSALATMDLMAMADRAVSTLSGGERARALLARVLAGQPRWILADEPLAHLDLSHARTLMAALRAQARRGVGVAVVVHDLTMAMNHAARVVVMHEGRIVADGPPVEALSPDVLHEVWGVRGRWLGDVGEWALAISG
ncbi:ATP-binding cassette domain-containing protein [Novosphingobium sp. FSY-8]|uniref:ATP-binding cassette domain-containing protein n=1 Tax=Novosphingobium ovatum TaxID=1908523 RepID=A0ABW9X9U0_9SPHN|nr:ABC transporter ATP-binding protein [Novosphingobium ovatum]NBC35299.1 ATP-binding cassette domain-containing protein [Novosphingobium ovatum]